jgi:hypothetical protein
VIYPLDVLADFAVEKGLGLGRIRGQVKSYNLKEIIVSCPRLG